MGITEGMLRFDQDKKELERKKVLFIATKKLDYIRVRQEIKLLEQLADEVKIIGSNKKSYPGRLSEIYIKLLFINYSQFDIVFIGFMAQLAVPVIHKRLQNCVLYVDFFISLYDTLAYDRKVIKPGGLPAKIVRWIDRETLRYADRVICDTAAHGKYFTQEFRLSPNKLRLLYLEADRSIFYPRKQVKPLRWSNKFLVLYFGSILPLQGIDVVLKSIEILKDEDDIHFIMIGPVKRKDRTKNQNVTYIEWLPQDKLAEYISYSDLCLAGHFSKEIGKADRTIPGKAYIYRSMKKRMILGESTANREIFEEGTGLFVERGNPEKLAGMIKKIAMEELAKRRTGKVDAQAPLVSIIIPVYNIEPYIGRCIQSVINQSYRNLEILLVDDGSSDRSGEICDDYAGIDDRIVVIHQENGGLSDARNKALDRACGEWIAFIDGDDWVHKEYISSLLRTAVERQATIVTTAIVPTYHDMPAGNETGGMNGKVILFDQVTGIKNLLYQKYVTTAAPGKLFYSKLWKDIRFPYGKLYEDVEVIYRILAKGEGIAFIKAQLYYYSIRPGSIVRSKFSLDKMDYVDHCRQLLDHVRLEFPALEKAALSRLLWSEIHVLVHMDSNIGYQREHELLWSDIKRNRREVIFDIHSRLINKLVLLISYGGDRLLKFFFNLKVRSAR